MVMNENYRTHCALTGLPLRREAMKQLSEIVESAAECEGGAVGVVFANIFRLKIPHDDFGHPAVDEALQKVAKIVQSLAGESGIACRYGGNTFLLILPDTSPEETKRKAEELREAARRVTFERDGQICYRVTLSIGVAHTSTFTTHTRFKSSNLAGAEALMAMADWAMSMDRFENDRRSVAAL